MTIEILGLKNCDTCKKAHKALPDAQLRDVRAHPLSAAEIDGLLSLFGEALINRASTTWRGLSDEERALPPTDLLARHPALMKRPVIRRGNETYLGWKPATQAALGI